MRKYWFPTRPAHYIILPPCQSLHRCCIFASAISQALALISNLTRECIIQQLPTLPCSQAHYTCFCFNSTPGGSLIDKHVTPANLHTHTHRSDTNFQHSLLLGCFYLGDLPFPLAALNSQLPWHWIKIETIFTPSWSFLIRRSCAVWDKDLLEQLGPPKIPPHLYAQSASSEFHLSLNSLQKVVEKRQAAETISSFESMDAGIHFPNCLPSLRGLLGSIPGLQWATHIFHSVMSNGGLELMDGVKEAANNSLQLKRENRKQGKLSWASVKTKRWEKLSWFFQMPSLSTVRGSVVMKLKFLKQDQQLEWNLALRNGTVALKISFMFNWMFTTTLLHGAFLLIKYQVEKYSVHPILPSHPDKTDYFSEITGQAYKIFLLFFSGDRDYIRSIYSVGTVRPLQYTGAWCMVLAFQTFWYPVIPISYWDWKVNWVARRKMPPLLWQPRRISQMLYSNRGINR